MTTDGGGESGPQRAGAVRRGIALRLPDALSIAAGLAALTVHAITLGRFPRAFVDEGWAAGRAWGLLHAGQAWSSLDSGVFDRFDGYWTFLPWIPSAAQSIAYLGASHPTLLAVRVVSLVWGAVLLAAVHRIARHHLGPWPALAALVLTACSLPFFYSSHLARADVMAAALGLTALAADTTVASSRRGAAFASGLFAGIACEVHAHAVVYLVALAALHLDRERRALLRSRRFWAFAAGVTAAAAIYIGLHVVRYPHTYAALNRLAFSSTHVPPVLTGDPVVLASSVRQMGSLLWTLHGPMALVSGAALAWLAIRPTLRDRALVIAAAALLAGFVLLLRNKFPYYGILYSPALDLVNAAALARVAAVFASRGPRGRTMVGLAMACLVAGQLSKAPDLGRDLTAAHDRRNRELAALVRPGESLMGPQTYWFGLFDHRYLSWEAIAYYRRFRPGATVADALEALRPDVLVIDEHVGRFISDTPAPAGYFEELRVPAKALFAFLDARADRIAGLRDPFYGAMTVYRIRWPH